MRENGTDTYCDAMTAALTPALALDYVRELSADVRTGVVLDAAGELLAGPPVLAGPARALLAAGGRADELEAVSGDWVVCAVRTREHAAIVVCGRFAIAAIVRQDLRAAVAALAGRSPEADAPLEAFDGAPPQALSQAVDALIAACRRAPGA
jgi:hypothetical protein